jgi:hypothetical protein
MTIFCGGPVYASTSAFWWQQVVLTLVDCMNGMLRNLYSIVHVHLPLRNNILFVSFGVETYRYMCLLDRRVGIVRFIWGNDQARIAINRYFACAQ